MLRWFILLNLLFIVTVLFLSGIARVLQARQRRDAFRFTAARAHTGDVERYRHLFDQMELEMADPTTTDPDKYSVVFENDHVRVLEYRDQPGAKTQPHSHPNSVMITLSGFDRRLAVNDKTAEVSLSPHEVRWLDAQTHHGENIGSTPTHVIFVELKNSSESKDPTLGPTS